MSDDDSVLFERRGPIGILTLNRPERMNTINLPLTEALLAAVQRLRVDYDTRVVILTGAGRMFCAGADLKGPPVIWKDGLGRTANSLGWTADHAAIIHGLRGLPQPVIGAINGAAAGGGFSLALACDIRIAAPEAKFGCSFVQVGLSAAEMGSSFFLPRLINSSAAAEMMYTGRIVEAEEALKLGIISRIVPAESLLDEALALANVMITRVTPLGLRLTKEAFTESMNGWSLESALKFEIRNQSVAGSAEDAREARSAFLEKRTPQFFDR